MYHTVIHVYGQKELGTDENNKKGDCKVKKIEPGAENPHMFGERMLKHLDLTAPTQNKINFQSLTYQ